MQWGEPRSEAFAIDARVAGSSVTVASLAAPNGQPLVLAVSGGQSRLVMSGMRNVGQGGSDQLVLRRVLVVRRCSVSVVVEVNTVITFVCANSVF